MFLKKRYHKKNLTGVNKIEQNIVMHNTHTQSHRR